jgi:hypothetical protein
MNRLKACLPLAMPPERAVLRIHDKAWWIRMKVEQDFFDGALKFAVVRDPYDHALSYWRFLRRYPGSDRHADAQGWSLGDFLRYLARKDVFTPMCQTSWLSMSPGFRRPAEALLVNEVLRFETIEADFRALAVRLRVPAPALPHLNRTSELLGRELYGEPERALIRRIYAADFERFGYAA